MHTRTTKGRIRARNSEQSTCLVSLYDVLKKFSLVLLCVMLSLWVASFLPLRHVWRLSAEISAKDIELNGPPRQNMLPKDGEYARAVADHSTNGGETANTLDRLIQAPTRLYHVFQVSLPRTGSTALTNILIGLFESPDQHYAFTQWNEGRGYETYYQRQWRPNHVTIVSKTHAVDIHHLQSFFAKDYDRMFFVAVNRKSTRILDEFCSPENDNIICLEYEDLLYQNEHEMAQVVSMVRRRIQEEFHYFSNVQFNERGAVTRLKEMGEMILQMKDASFEHVDPKFGVHGGHRNRKD